MDLLERFSSKFGAWYEGLFGADGGELRPKDVLRKIIAAMEDNRKEGIDSKVYVPNKYVLELTVSDAEERDYLLSFLDEEELVSVLQRFMAQHQYHIRGPLDFTVQEVGADQKTERAEKLRVRVRFEKGELPAAVPDPAPAQPVAQSSYTPPASAAAPAQYAAPAPSPYGVPARLDDDDLPTIASFRSAGDDDRTVPAVAWASLSILGVDGRKRHESVTRPVLVIGRSRNAGNDLVLSDDGKVSKQHARIERDMDGGFTISDLGSTNGVLVNGQRTDGPHRLQNGDEILIGDTRLTFHLPGGDDAPLRREEQPDPAARRNEGAPRRAVLIGPNGAEYILASETLIGRALTADIVLDAPGVSMRHARVISPDPSSYFIEDLGSDAGTVVNGRAITPRSRTPLAPGDVIRTGPVELRFSGGAI